MNPTRITLKMTNGSVQQPLGIIEIMLMKVDSLHFLQTLWSWI